MQSKREDDVALEVPRACTACGVVLERRDRDHCDDCLPEELRNNAIAFREAGRTKMEALRAAGEDPAHTEATRQRRGEALAHSKRDAHEWEAAHGGEANPEVFLREILPGLQEVPLSAMARATNLSEGYCSFIRRGIKVPHRRHWDELSRLAKPSAPDG